MWVIFVSILQHKPNMMRLISVHVYMMLLLFSLMMA